MSSRDFSLGESADYNDTDTTGEALTTHNDTDNIGGEPQANSTDMEFRKSSRKRSRSEDDNAADCNRRKRVTRDHDFEEVRGGSEGRENEHETLRHSPADDEEADLGERPDYDTVMKDPDAAQPDLRADQFPAHVFDYRYEAIGATSRVSSRGTARAFRGTSKYHRGLMRSTHTLLLADTSRSSDRVMQGRGIARRGRAHFYASRTDPLAVFTPEEYSWCAPPDPSSLNKPLKEAVRRAQYEGLVTKALFDSHRLSFNVMGTDWPDMMLYWENMSRRRYAGNGTWQPCWNPYQSHFYYVSPTGEPQWHIPQVLSSRPGHLPPGWIVRYDRNAARVYYTCPDDIDHSVLPWTPAPLDRDPSGWEQMKVRGDYVAHEDNPLNLVAGEMVRVTQHEAYGYKVAMKLEGHGDMDWIMLPTKDLEHAAPAETSLRNAEVSVATVSPYTVCAPHILDHLYADMMNRDPLPPPFAPLGSASRPFNRQPWDAETFDQRLAPTAEAVASMRAHLITESEDGSTTDCSICMEEAVVGSYVAELPCHHWFHHACVWQWLTSKESCPYCRRAY